MTLQRVDDGSAFTSGAGAVLLAPGNVSERANRIQISVSLEGFETAAFVDTGGVYVLCPPEIARAAGITQFQATGQDTILFRGQRLHGNLYRAGLTLIAHRGRSLQRDVTVFVAQGTPDDWEPDFPCVLGLTGCLENLRFAVDPERDEFHFGDLGDNA